MNLVGDKICANLLAQSVGVNVIPWSGSGLKSIGVDLSEQIIADATLKDLQAAEQSAARVGFPLMIKVRKCGPRTIRRGEVRGEVRGKVRGVDHITLPDLCVMVE
eukprot:1194564-Prorocentrum_minimum.AAC.7